MRLNSIKLSGFKSFAEPTHFQLPGQLVGVVGPNGCGKSNIMDAVRWVLGESKASELRGESMQDVIFNGSGERKPASRASVELVFGNEDARAGGPWNRFTEIAVKRVLTRDGTSSYYINNQPVRRRDVQDVFLGTGLGPRAYAIIGQGTISRIIESRPEELRLFLEEAAGVSKYKERRRETENRLKDTRENLTRVEDILRELHGHLDRLEQQAQVASQYRSLQQQGTLKLHQLWFLKYRDATQEQARIDAEVREAILQIESRTADLRQGEAELETLRQTHYVAGDALHSAQGAMAEAALEVSRLEERIRYMSQGRERLTQRLAEVHAQIADWLQRQTHASEELKALMAQLDAASENSALLQFQLEEQSDRLPGLEEALRQGQGRASEQRVLVTQVQQQIQLLAVEGRSIKEQIRQLGARRDRLQAEQQQLADPDASRLSELRRQWALAQESYSLSEACLHELTEQLPGLDESRRQQQEVVNAEMTKQAELSARLEALRALQDKLQTEGRLKPWLAQQGLEGLAGLWMRLNIEPGWEAALESVLRERLGALEVSRLESVEAFALNAPPSKLTFYTSEVRQGACPIVSHGLTALIDWLRLGDAGLRSVLADWLAGVYTCLELSGALAARSKLTSGEIIVTPEGHLVSRGSVTFYAPDSEQAGLLARAQDIEHLQRQQRAQNLMTEESRSVLVRFEAAYTEASSRLAALRRQVSEQQAQMHHLKLEVLSLSQHLEQTKQRRSQLDEELTEIDAQLEALAERCATGEARFEVLDIDLANSQERYAQLEDEVIQAERHLAQFREQLRSLERQTQEAEFACRSLQARGAELQRTIDIAGQQIGAHRQSLVQVEQELLGLTDSVDQNRLDEALAYRLNREADLSAKRSEYDDLSLRMRKAEERRMAYEQSLQPLRNRLTQLQLEAQAVQLGGAQYQEQLATAQIDLDALAQTIEAEHVRLHGLQSEIDRIHREVNALGAVNLAALDELTSVRERKQFLDSQNADLLNAIQTLEDAIRKIDLETRELLSSTFHQVNTHFGHLFPSLFGGGNARLVMTGAEILDAGVQVMAQPPGKKNSTIHLLSGGEKALTAIALVFAIFQLNPAPFCLLDEVDAPLDDANTDRYARLVKKMSGETQFLFISHNKIAMEMAEQLVGVTMQEQGVSRIVAVDMQAAVRMAEAA
ncbi:MAG: chromosome segregation protein SMC [Burkholderiales bacterium]